MQVNSLKAEFAAMDASSDGLDRRQSSWSPNRVGLVSGRPFSGQGLSSSGPPESLDTHGVRFPATAPFEPRRPWDTDGYLSYSNSYYHRSSNGGVILPSLSETRLLSRPAVESSSDTNSLGDPLSTSSQHGLRRVPRVASQNAPVDPAAPTAAPSSSYQSTISQSRALSNSSLPWREASFTDVYQFPERRWRRVYDRDFSSFASQNDAQATQDFRHGSSDRRNVGLSQNTYTRPVHGMSRETRESNRIPMSSSSSGPHIRSKAGSETPANDVELQNLMREIQMALHHPEYQLRHPLPTVDLDSLEDKSCNICYDEYCVANPEGIIEQPVKLDGCGHVFGSHCLEVWMRSRTNWKCPMCRVKIKPFVDTLYDNNLWVEYQQVRGRISTNDCLALLRRIIESKNRVRPPMKGLVVQQRSGKKGRPAPDAANESQQRRVRFRSNDAEEEVDGSSRTSEASSMATSGLQPHRPLSYSRPTATEHQDVPLAIQSSGSPWSAGTVPAPLMECFVVPPSYAPNVPNSMRTNSSGLAQLANARGDQHENPMMAPDPPYHNFGEADIYEYSMPMFGSETSEDE